ncbi:MAG: hypothetical protein COY80_03095 [Candidatus Pacebacteria bacterium CG_4_10_14_0_8_um_filter_42_14]|nr:MAG: hypothetical protein COY80_03095 [Candidatus Pacebacteria bacterium CG_4_10_14_0_8_um_filter_42_14]
MYISRPNFPTIEERVDKDLVRLATEYLRNNLALGKNETILIVTVTEMLKTEAAIWTTAAQELSESIELVCLHDMSHSGEEPPEEIIAAATNASVTIFQTDFSLTHTQAGKNALLSGGRALSLPGADLNLIKMALETDYVALKTLGLSLEKKLRAGETIRVTSEEGTDLTAGIRTDAVEAETGFLSQGEIGNLPSGEVFFAPLLGTTNGTLVIDGSIADDVLDSPITVEIKDGSAVKFSGGVAAKNLQEKLSQYGEKGMIVAEIGIGTNINARVCDNLLEAEKAYGTVHVAFGNSSAIGGENNVPIHIDGLVSKPAVYVDEEKILENKAFIL